jgi:hypothetical protein
MAFEIGGDPLSELRLADVLGTLGFGASFEDTANYLIDRFTGAAVPIDGRNRGTDNGLRQFGRAFPIRSACRSDVDDGMAPLVFGEHLCASASVSRD